MKYKESVFGSIILSLKNYFTVRKAKSFHLRSNFVDIPQTSGLKHAARRPYVAREDQEKWTF